MPDRSATNSKSEILNKFKTPMRQAQNAGVRIFLVLSGVLTLCLFWDIVSNLEFSASNLSLPSALPAAMTGQGLYGLEVAANGA